MVPDRPTPPARHRTGAGTLLTMPTRLDTTLATKILPLLCVLIGLLGGGCAKEPVGSASFRIPAAEYDAYFEAAKDALRDQQFDLERVDARAGVMTTRPVSSAGWATPWIRHASTIEQSTNDLIQRNRRIATVRFARVSDETNVPSPVDPVASDLREFEGTIEVSVNVVVEQVYRSGRRLAPASIRLTTFTVDPSEDTSGPEQLRTRIVGTDAPLSALLADAILRSASK